MSVRKEDGTLLIAEEFSVVSKDKIRKLVAKSKKSDLVDFIVSLSQVRAFSWRDRMLLQMVDKSSLTFWASDKNYVVRLWEGSCNDTYGTDMHGRKCSEFISRYEMQNMLIDSVDMVEARGANAVNDLIKKFKNYYTQDNTNGNRPLGIITNSLQLYDKDANEYFYAEIGLPIDDLKNVIREYEERQSAFKKTFDDFNVDCAELDKENSAHRAKRLDEVYTVLNQKRKEELLKTIEETYSEIKKTIKEEKESRADKFDDCIDQIRMLLIEKYSSIDSLIADVSKPITTETSEDGVAERKRQGDELMEYQTIFIDKFERLKEEVQKTINGTIATTAKLNYKKRLDEIDSRQKEIRDELIIHADDVQHCSPMMLKFKPSTLKLIQEEVNKEIEKGCCIK